MPRYTHDGYGMLERNRVDPEIMESQCELDATAYPNGAEVGMIVGVDKANGKLVKPTDNYDKGLLANSERLYDQYHQGLKNYYVAGGEMGSVLFPQYGWTWTTNTFGYSTGDFADETALNTALEALGTTPLYATWDADGVMQVTPTAAGAAMQVVKYYTMPDGQPGIKVMVIRDNLFRVQ